MPEPTPAGTDPRPGVHSGGSERPRCVLVVDDDDSVRQMLAKGMAAHGWSVHTAACCQEAVQLYRHHHAAIDVVLLDVIMPGEDGPQTLVALRELHTNIRFCFMTGETGQHTVESLLELGAAFVVQKPFRFNDLSQWLLRLADPVEHPGGHEDHTGDGGGRGRGDPLSHRPAGRLESKTAPKEA